MRTWGPADAARCIAVPDRDDDKYSRGVLGVVTGSAQYPGAAVLGVEAALHTGVGMVRYLGAAEAATLVLQRRPEAVTAPGRVQAWLLGSGMDAATRTAGETRLLLDAIAEDVPCVLDAGALDLALDIEARGVPGALLTPHHGELARLLGVERREIERDPAHWAAQASAQFGAVVLLKGAVTVIADGDELIEVDAATPWLATAGAGDALGGILGALLATNAAAIIDDPRMPARLAATAAFVHGRAAAAASMGGPFTVLDLCAAVPGVIREVLAGAS